MNNTQGVQFGSLTAKRINYMSFEELDANKDGYLTQEEINHLFDNIQIDILDLSTIDIDADKKVTQQEYELWQQEADIETITDKIKEQVIRDFIGHDEDDIKKVLKMIDEYKISFIQNFQKNGNISEMSERYKQQLPVKYQEIKQYVIQNTKSAIKNRVVESIIQEVINDNSKANKEYSGIIKDTMFTMSDNTRRLLSNELSKEAEKYIKIFDGENLEEALANHLRDFLKSTDKSKLSEVIYLWENSKEKLNKLPQEAVLNQLKNDAKIFLQEAVNQGIFITLGKITVRTQVAIVPALAQYKDSFELQQAIDKIISTLSTYTKLEQIKYTSTVQKTESADNNDKFFNPYLNAKNIFKQN